MKTLNDLAYRGARAAWAGIQRRNERVVPYELTQNPTGEAGIRLWLRKEAAQLSSGSIVLDAGAGSAPYRNEFSESVYETADFMQATQIPYAQPTYRCDLSSIPVEDGRFDLVLCTQVLEHVPDPDAVMRELNRVLKPDGRLLLSVPLCFEEHMVPFDFYRFTQWGIKEVASRSGFEVLELTWLEGYYAALAHQLAIAARSIRPSHARWLEGSSRQRLGSAAIAAGSALFASYVRLFQRMDAAHLETEIGTCLNYRITLRKALPASSGQRAQSSDLDETG